MRNMLMVLILAGVMGFGLAMGQTATRPGVVSAEARAAGDEIVAYMNGHMGELGPKLDAAKFDRFGGAGELEKFRPLLPEYLAAKLEVAKPALLETFARVRDSVIGNNLKAVGQLILINDTRVAAAPDQYKSPRKVGDLVAVSDRLDIFVAPGMVIPENVRKGTKAEQAAWVDANTIYALVATFKAVKDVPADAVMAIERLEADANKAKVAVLYGDGRVELVEREKVAALVKKK